MVVVASSSSITFIPGTLYREYSFSNQKYYERKVYAHTRVGDTTTQNLPSALVIMHHLAASHVSIGTAVDLHPEFPSIVDIPDVVGRVFVCVLLEAIWVTF